MNVFKNDEKKHVHILEVAIIINIAVDIKETKVTTSAIILNVRLLISVFLQEFIAPIKLLVNVVIIVAMTETQLMTNTISFTIIGT